MGDYFIHIRNQEDDETFNSKNVSEFSLLLIGSFVTLLLCKVKVTSLIVYANLFYRYS